MLCSSIGKDAAASVAVAKAAAAASHCASHNSTVPWLLRPVVSALEAMSPGAYRQLKHQGVSRLIEGLGFSVLQHKGTPLFLAYGTAG